MVAGAQVPAAWAHTLRGFVARRHLATAGSTAWSKQDLINLCPFIAAREAPVRWQLFVPREWHIL